jgi:hypothetical protein
VGGKVSPIPLYKEPVWRRVGHKWTEGVPLEELSSPLTLMLLPSPFPMPLTLMWLPEGPRRSEVKSTAARRRAAGIPDQIQTDLPPQS